MEQMVVSILTNAVVRFFVPDLNGGYLFAGRSYSPYTGGLTLKVTSGPENSLDEMNRLGYF